MGAGDAGGFSKDMTDTGLMCERSCAGLKEPSRGSGQPHTHTNPLWVLRTPKGKGDQVSSREPLQAQGFSCDCGRPTCARWGPVVVVGSYTYFQQVPCQ